MADRLLAEAGVACVSGAAFGEYGDGYVRFSYAASYESLMEAVRRIGDFVRGLPVAAAGQAIPVA
jgi:aspartate aminotransferase